MTLSPESPLLPLMVERRNHHMQEYRWLGKLVEAAPEHAPELIAVRGRQRGLMRAIRAIEALTGQRPWDGT